MLAATTLPKVASQKRTDCRPAAEKASEDEAQDEFYDALDTEPQHAEEAASNMSRLRASRLPAHSLDPSHPLTQEIAMVCQAHWDSWGASTAGMELLEADGNLRVYRRRLEQEGSLQDPILVTHVLSGVTAGEVADLFWNLKYRMDWEHTLDVPPIVLDTPSPDTLLLQQIYKRVWPTTQRESVFWSRIARHPMRSMVVNFSTETGAPKLQASRLRMMMNIGLVCENQFTEAGDSQRLPAVREQLRCRVQYSACLNPSGWVPKPLLRQLARREYPRFMRKFAAYCTSRSSGCPVPDS